MTIRFAAARPALLWGVTIDTRATQVRRPANDIGGDGPHGDAFGHDPLLRDALKHFAAHGLGAADSARAAAERAFFAGDRQAYRHWLAICRMLDRRMAGAVAARFDSASAG